MESIHASSGDFPDSWGKSGILAILRWEKGVSLPLALIFLKKMVGGTGIEPVTPPCEGSFTPSNTL